MKKALFCLFVFVLSICMNTNAQSLAVNSTGATADASAILDVQSTTKGFLAPKMTSAQRAAIATPATGLVVYQTDGTTGFYYNAGTSGSPSWVQLLPANAVVPATSGGTGQSSYTTGDILYASSSSALAKLNAGTSGKVLTSSGAGTAPSWQSVGGSATTIGTASTALTTYTITNLQVTNQDFLLAYSNTSISPTNLSVTIPAASAAGLGRKIYLMATYTAGSYNNYISSVSSAGASDKFYGPLVNATGGVAPYNPANFTLITLVSDGVSSWYIINAY